MGVGFVSCPLDLLDRINESFQNVTLAEPSGCLTESFRAGSEMLGVENCRKPRNSHWGRSLGGTQAFPALGCTGNLTRRWTASALSWEQMEEKVQGKLSWRLKEARGGSLPGRSLGPQLAVQAEVGGSVRILVRSQSLENWGSFAAAPVSLSVFLVRPQSILLPAWRLPRLQNGANVIRVMRPLPSGLVGDPVWRMRPPSLLPPPRQML